jgi:DNA-binding Lrp family transcriptional regulator
MAPMSRVAFNLETLAQAKPDGEPLLRRHWAEIAHYQDIPYAPRWEVYETLERAGILRIYTARLDGDLIGYAVYALGYNMHYGSSLEATEDVLFLVPEQRKGRVGLKLIKFTDALLKVEGVQLVKRHVKFAHDHGRILQRMGYEAIDAIYGKRLDIKE